METIKCPACGTSNSAKRQICHICGQLLLQAGDHADAGNIELLNDDLKAATEAALKEVSRASQSRTGETKTAVRDVKSSGSSETAIRPRTRKDRNILVVAVVVTVIALGFILFFILGSNTSSGGNDDTNKPRKVIQAPSIGLTHPTSVQPPVSSAGQQVPVVRPSQPTQTQRNPTRTVPKTNALEQAGISGASSILNSVLTRINADLGISLSASGVNYSGMVSQSGNDTSVVSVTMQGTSFSGTASVLIQKLGGNWQPMYSKDWSITFATPVTLQNAAGQQQTFSGARLATGGFQPLNDVASQDISY